MKRVRTIFGILKYELNQIFFSHKFIIVFLMSFMFMDFYIRDLRQMADDYNIGIFPAVNIFYFSDITYSNIALLLVVLLFSDLPNRNGGQIFIRLRAGKQEYEVGQIAAVIVTSIGYVFIESIQSVIVCIPHVDFSGWGKLWGTVASHNLSEFGYGNHVSVDQNIITNYEPVQAVIYASIIFFLMCVIYGLFIYLANKLSGMKLGTTILSVWSVMWIFLDSIDNDYVNMLRAIAPQKWNDIAMRMPKDNSIIIVVELVICAMLCGAILFCVNKDKTRW